MKLLTVFAIFLACATASPLAAKERTEEIAPTFDPDRDMRFFVLTRFNPVHGQEIFLNNLTSLDATNYNRDRSTRFIIHGFQDDASAEINVVVSAAYLRTYDVNIIVVDWGVLANTINYITARNRVPDVGRTVASLIDFMHANNRIDFGRTYLIGSSLGAHIAGFTGKQTQRGRVNTIIGSDPAGPLFNANDPTTRLAAGDAQYVECIHTDNRNFGIGLPICDVDWFPNGGSHQPGCLTSLCDHSRAFHLYAESLNLNLLWGRRCNNLEETTTSSCFGDGAFLGGEPSNQGRQISGIYFLRTNGSPPFGQGHF